MSSAVSDKKQLVEEIVVALTGAPADTARASNLVDQMARAAKEVDERTAGAFGKALLDNLCEDPGNVRLLEALMILGLAHPDVLRRRGISLAMEGRRLAILLEQRGESERARCLVELIASKVPDEPRFDATQQENTDQGDGQPNDDVVERYLKSARACVKAHRIPEAITWLQEVLLVDRSRRDVARMIRDLRYQDSEGRQKRKKFARNAAAVILLVCGVAWLVKRELRIRDFVRALPVAGVEDGELRARLASLEGVIADHYVWLGLLDARDEIEGLRAELERRREKELDAEKQLAVAEARKLELAEAARLRGLMRIERGEFEAALEDFAQSLALSGEQWEHRARVQADVAALEAWKRGER